MPSSPTKAKLSARAQENYLRAKRERPSFGLLSEKKAEPTLDEAREELAQSISRLAHSLFADRFGPLVGTITETTVTASLKEFEEHLRRAKGDFNLVLNEFSERIFKK